MILVFFGHSTEQLGPVVGALVSIQLYRYDTIQAQPVHGPVLIMWSVRVILIFVVRADLCISCVAVGVMPARRLS